MNSLGHVDIDSSNCIFYNVEGQIEEINKDKLNPWFLLLQGRTKKY